MATSTTIRQCQICGNDHLQSIQFFCFLPPVNQMPEIGSVPQEQSAYPLELLRCQKCTLGQLGLEVDAEILFPHEYPYLSGSTKILRENFAHLYQEVLKVLPLTSKDLVVDIGSNDGTLLSNFNGKHQVLGIEPSQAGDVAMGKSIRTRKAYFGKETANQVEKEFGKAKVITAANVFAHMPSIHEIVSGVLQLLDSNGVFVSESHYLLDLIETVQYDTIYHEHLRYYSVTSLKYLFDQHGLEIFKVQRIPTHGGSIRVFASRKGVFKSDESLEKFLNEEKLKGLVSGEVFSHFTERVVRSKLDLMSIIRDIRAQKKRIFGIGAPSRASTLINYISLDDRLIDCVCEVKGSHKIGRYIPGTRIPVVEEAALFEKQPDYALLLSWHISDELKENLKKKGFKGKFIVPLPEARIES